MTAGAANYRYCMCYLNEYIGAAYVRTVDGSCSPTHWRGGVEHAVWLMGEEREYSYAECRVLINTHVRV